MLKLKLGIILLILLMSAVAGWITYYANISNNSRTDSVSHNYMGNISDSSIFNKGDRNIEGSEGSLAQQIQRRIEPAQKFSNANRESPSQVQIQIIIGKTCKEAYQNHQDKIMEYGVSEGVFVSTCYSDLNGMAHIESRHDPGAVGDIGNGDAYGIVQINQYFHPNTKDCALDVACATKYAIDRLMQYGYPRFRTRAITCWNSCNNPFYGEIVKRSALMYE